MGLFASVFPSVEKRLCWRGVFTLLTQTHPRPTDTPLPIRKCKNLNNQNPTPKQHHIVKPRLLLAATLTPRERQQCFWLLRNIVLGKAIFRSWSTTEKTGYLPPVVRRSLCESHHCCVCLTQQDPDVHYRFGQDIKFQLSASWPWYCFKPCPVSPFWESIHLCAGFLILLENTSQYPFFWVILTHPKLMLIWCLDSKLFLARSWMSSVGYWLLAITSEEGYGCCCCHFSGLGTTSFCKFTLCTLGIPFVTK